MRSLTVNILLFLMLYYNKDGQKTSSKINLAEKDSDANANIVDFVMVKPPTQDPLGKDSAEYVPDIKGLEFYNTRTPSMTVNPSSSHMLPAQSGSDVKTIDDRIRSVSHVGLYSKDTKHGPSILEKLPQKRGAVASNSKFSAQIAIDILKKGGSAADAAIACLLAEGVANPHSMGIGGGFLLTYYDQNTKKADFLNARECAPGRAYEKMFRTSNYLGDGLSVAVPGELKGYWELHKRYGKLQWKDLFQPVINACREGVAVSSYASGIMNIMKKKIKNSPTLKYIFQTDTGDLYSTGDLMRRNRLADILEMVADEGPNVLYNGKLTDGFIEDITSKGGIITKEDMQNYRATWCEPTQSTLLGHLQMYSAPTPGAGIVQSFIMDVIESIPKTQDPLINWFRIVETWKHAFGLKFTFDGPVIGKKGAQTRSNTSYKSDPNLTRKVREKVLNSKRTSDDVRHYTDSYGSVYYGGGTCHISIVANGDAVAVTSSINSAFGAFFASPSTGIILNNSMMDFNIPEYNTDIVPTNKIVPNRQPISSMSPTIIVDPKTNQVKFVIGAAGGTKIVTAVSQVLIEHFLYDIPVKEAVKNQRLHHSLIPMKLKYEDGFPHEIIHGLAKLGHTLKMLESGFESDYFIPASSSVSLISIEENNIIAVGDPRRNGVSLDF